jgi:hypothetical protein
MSIRINDLTVRFKNGVVAVNKASLEIPKGIYGQPASVDSKADNDTLRKFMSEVLPDYDRDRVYPSDIRKLISWYNLLINNNITDFVSKEEEAVAEEK